MRIGKEMIERHCSICGKQLGNNIDHTACSIEKKNIYGDKNVTKKPKKKLYRKQINQFSKFINKIDIA